MIDQGAGRLLLQGGHSSVELIAAQLVRSPEPRVRIRRPGHRHVVDRRHRPPDVDEGLVGDQARHGIDQSDVRGELERNPDQPVLSKIAEVARVLAVDSEVVGVDRTEKRIIGIGHPRTTHAQPLKSRFDVRRRQLETVVGHVAVGAGAAIGAETLQVPVDERPRPAVNRIARVRAAVHRRVAREAGDDLW